MCGSGASRHTTSGGLYPSVKVASLSSLNWWVMFAPSSRRAKMPGNPGTLGSGTLAYTPAMVLQVRRTGVRVRAGWKFFACAGEVRKAGSGAGGSLVPVVPTWQACFGACLSGAAFLVLCWGSRRSLSAWTYKRETEDARALVLSRIWSI